MGQSVHEFGPEKGVPAGKVRDPRQRGDCEAPKR